MKNKKQKKHRNLLYEAVGIDGNIGYLHREHRTKKNKCGFVSPKKEKLTKLKEEELFEEMRLYAK